VPFKWALSRFRQEHETLTFEADMGFPPGFHLDIVRHRWSGHTGTKKKRIEPWMIVPPGAGRSYHAKNPCDPAELTPVVNALASCRDKDFVSVRFHPTAAALRRHRCTGQP